MTNRGCRASPAGFPPPVGGGLRPAPLGKASFHANFCWFPNVSNHRVGADLCVRPLPLFARPVHGPTHRSAPTKRPSTPKTRAGTEPRPYSRQIPNAGSRYARPSSTPSPTRQSVRNDSGHQSLHLPSPVPTFPVNARSEAPALRLSKISRNSVIVSKGRAAALPLVVSRRPGGKYEIPWKSFLERERIFF